MKISIGKKLVIGIFLSVLFIQAEAQDNKKWTLEECITYALSMNIDLQNAELARQRNELSLEQSKASKLPSLNSSAGFSSSWSRQVEQDAEWNFDGYSGFDGSQSINVGLNSSITLYNGNRLKNQTKQSELNLLSSEFAIERTKETMELNILNSYLQLLYAVESVNNAEKQIESTQQELLLADERLELGIISQSDYLQLKSELASEKLTLTDANSSLEIAKLNLMQLMELPVTTDFDIAIPVMDEMLNQQRDPDASGIYNNALTFKPQIKQVEISKENAILSEKIAKAGQLPSITAGANVNSRANLNGTDYANRNVPQQLASISPGASVSLSMPIFRNKQNKISIATAKIGIQEAELNEINAKKTLLKDIEQAALNVVVAQERYESNLEDFAVATETMNIAEERFSLGLINSVDYLFQKTSFIVSESRLLQAKYNLIFTYKILDFYKGIPLTL